MAPQERSEIVQLLEDSHADFRAAVDGVSEFDAKVCPAPGRWSVLQCVEHIVISESRFLGWLKNPIADPAPPVDKEKEAKLLAGVAGRAQRVEAPEPARPTGRFATLAEAMEQFDAARAKSIGFAESHGAGLYTLAARHPFFGVCNGLEVMVLMAAHARRHAAQIREIRAAL
jgi:DinB superfamily